MGRPRSRIRWETALLALGMMGSALAQDSGKTVETTFVLSPPNARVYLKTQGSESALPLEHGKALVTFPSEYVRENKEIEFRFSVPQWFGREYPDWKNLTGAERETFRAFGVTANYDTLRKSKKIPTQESSFRLPLPVLVAFQAYTLAYPGIALVGVVMLLGLAVGATRWRQILLKLVPKPEVVDPNRVGDYILKKKIGEGGMGEVWAATSVSSLNCAIKFIRKELAEDEEYKRRLEREIKACIPLRHRNLLRLHGYGVASDGRLYTVSELLVGQTLKEVIASGDFDPPQLAIKVVEQIGDALFYLHQRGLIHRDIKPDNIFVCEDGSLKLMDMGLIQGESLTVLTQTGAMMGTPAYMPPEQMGTKETCAASDQYSLGVVLYEILAGQRPFIQPDALLLAYQHTYVAAAPPSQHNGRISPEVDAAILQMLAKKPLERFRNLKAVQAALEPLGFVTWNDNVEETRAASIKKAPPTA